ncbi:MAG: aldo/keto reductase [Eubacteriales bacterium]|nr:aldo/keto reductase [Eubacteriales bacterium]
MMEIPKISLNDSVQIPAIGLGTFPMRGIGLIKAVIAAEKVGISMFDTSRAYHNERELGLALKLGRLKRKDVFVITKISNRQQETGDVRGALLSSLKRMNLSYVDLYLMHWPYPPYYLKTWKAMEDLQREGLARSIGVCNCHEHHLNALLDIAEIVPAVNEVEIHPLLSQEPLAQFCNTNNINMMAYSPLARMAPELVENDIIKNLAIKYGKTSVQIILRWDLQHGYIVIPKASKKKHMLENLSILNFELEESEMALIDGLNQNKRFRHNPDTCDFTKL